MKFGKILFASVALVASLGAQAQVTGCSRRRRRAPS